MTKKERNAARGQECTLRIAGILGCASTETTVLAHAPCRDKGIGFKSPDWWGAFACATCHDIIDGRRPDPWQPMAPGEIEAAWLRGIYETQKIQRQVAEEYEMKKNYGSLSAEVNAHVGIAQKTIGDALQKLHEDTGLIPESVSFNAVDTRTIEQFGKENSVCISDVRVRAKT